MSDTAVLVKKVDDLERWRDGNGKPGAAAMIADLEKRMESQEGKNACQDKVLADMAIAAAVAKATEKQAMIEAFQEAMRKRAHTTEGRIRAWGPYFVALCGLLGPLILYLASGK